MFDVWLKICRAEVEILRLECIVVKFIDVLECVVVAESLGSLRGRGSYGVSETGTETPKSAAICFHRGKGLNPQTAGFSFWSFNQL
jgi:hypothetical protein